MKSGSIVRLNSGGPRMTVMHIEAMAFCRWFDDNGVLLWNNFPVECLTLVNDNAIFENLQAPAPSQDAMPPSA